MNKLVFALLLAVAIPAGLHAQNYHIDWWTVDGGGGTSTGGVYTLVGTIGQPDAGKLAGGSFTLEGGFWGIVAVVQTPGAPFLAVERNPLNGVVTVYWPVPATGYMLDQTPTLTGSPAPWAQVAPPYQTNATHIYITLPSPPGNRFYRLRKP